MLRVVGDLLLQLSMSIISLSNKYSKTFGLLLTRAKFRILVFLKFGSFKVTLNCTWLTFSIFNLENI